MRKIVLSIEIIVLFCFLSACDRPARHAPVVDTVQPAVSSSRLAGLLGADADNAFPRVLAPREFRFPEDHGPHPEYRNEWWYVTGNLGDAAGVRLGYELTIFRFAMQPDPPASTSAWRSHQVYIGHFALTDPAADRFYAAERYSREGPGLAGARATPFRVWLDDWEMVADDSAPGVTGDPGWRLRAADGEVSIDLSLTALKAPVLNGEDGLSQKSETPGNASYYYSMTRLGTSGVVRIGDRSLQVEGFSWLDREWGSSALAADQVGWDWFALQLDDNSELMFYNIRGRDGVQGSRSAGTWVAADGTTRPLGSEDVRIRVLDAWNSPLGGRYPGRWQIEVPAFGLKADIEPVMADQELSTTVRYWEGAVDVAGTRDGRSVRGRGYVELTGYAAD